MVKVHFKKILKSWDGTFIPEGAYAPDEFDSIEIPEKGELPNLSRDIKDCYPDPNNIPIFLGLGKYTRHAIVSTYPFCDINSDHLPEGSIYVVLKKGEIQLRWVNERNEWVAIAYMGSDAGYKGPFVLDDFCAGVLLFTYFQSNRLSPQDVVKTHPKDLSKKAARTMPKFPEQAVIFQGKKTGLEYIIKFLQLVNKFQQHQYLIRAYPKDTIDDIIKKSNFTDKEEVGHCWGVYYPGKVTESINEPTTEVYRLEVYPPHDGQGLGSAMVQILYDVLPNPTCVSGRSETELAATKVRRIFAKTGFVEKVFRDETDERGVYIIEWEKRLPLVGGRQVK